MGTTNTTRAFRLAIAQLPITGDARQNSQAVRDAMRQAAAEIGSGA